MSANVINPLLINGTQSVNTAESNVNGSLLPNLIEDTSGLSSENAINNDPVWIWGVPFSALTRTGAVSHVMKLIETGQPSMFVTANTHYTMLTHETPALGEVNSKAAFVLADGAPLVWASRLKGTPLPERVAGSDLILDLCELAAARSYRPFLLGGAPGVAEAAANRLISRFPGLKIAGIACPSDIGTSDNDCEQLIEQIRSANADMLFAALGQPKGELWIARNLDRLEIPVCVQIGASLDFVAGRVSRAPCWIQKIGMEWAYRLSMEPTRLAPRYARNAKFLAKQLMLDLLPACRNNKAIRGGRSSVCVSSSHPKKCRK